MMQSIADFPAPTLNFLHSSNGRNLIRSLSEHTAAQLVNADSQIDLPIDPPLKHLKHMKTDINLNKAVKPTNKATNPTIVDPNMLSRFDLVKHKS